MSSLGNCFNHLFHRQKKTEKPTTENRLKETQEDPITDIVQPVPHRPADQPIQLTQLSQPRDLWQAAYDQLDETQRQILSLNKNSIKPGDENNSLRSSIDQVIQTTEAEYKKYHQTADGNFHKASRKIVNAALSFKDIIDAVAALDPTQHAASVWNIVSLGLTMAKSYFESREVLFGSSEYLAEILTYGAFVEKNFYENRNSIRNSHLIEKILIRLYKAILCYTAQIQQMHDASIGRKHEDFCLPKTRTHLLKQISTWAQSEGPFIFWLNGGAGTGKSTIARTVAQSFQEKGLLGATFFFKRGEADRGNSKRFISTITRQLVNGRPELKNEVLRAVEINSEIMTKSLNIQFEKLLYQPLMKLHSDQSPTIIIIIDALDECDGDSDLQLILHLLFKMQDIKSVCLRVFLASRPEFPIRYGFNNHQNHCDLVLHTLPKPMIEHDIRVFLEYKLSKIQHDRSLPLNWPGDEKREKLVQMAVPLFIFAATLCRFIGDIDWLPDSRLTAVLNDEAAAAASEMDRTYIPVLNQLLISKNEGDTRQLLQEFQDIIGVITLLATPLSVITLGQLISVSEDVISNRLNRFHAVLHVPDNLRAPVRILHLSFRDFLVSTETIFRIHEQETHAKIVSHCIRLMKAQLKQNICELQSYGTQQEDIDTEVVEQYSKDQILDCDVLSFLKEHFLHWLEVLALIGGISEAVGLINILKSRVWTQVGSELSDFFYDAERFTRQNSYMAGIAPLQLYRTGLIFAPTKSIIKKIFYGKVKDQLGLETAVEDSWSSNLQTFEGHSMSVLSVAFSPDGRTLATGSHDGTIKLWDTATGVEQRTLTGHASIVPSVAFSPDGCTLASGSDFGTVKLWNTATGVEQRTLTGHSDIVWSVAFSPDGRTLASGSHDGTIKLWDTATGVEQRTLTGHSHWVLSVAFSPDGRTLASGSADSTIKLWDTATGVKQRTLTGHSSIVPSVAFSPDGCTLASGAYDSTVKLWNTATGVEQRTLTGHSRSVMSVAFSPDGCTLMSCSDVGTIKLWNTATGVEQRTLTGHSGSISSVVNHSTTSYSISVADSWVSLRDERVLWLPTYYRCSCCFAIKDTTLALGSADGRVPILRFNFQ
ncbi:hypothetical protein ASPCADRAFT_519059 [Aspergillus carbonarius ITEM 5010]|uniref:Mitochondrial division protein 1 n=1 Tax=Aspergillus carbonarius (strain ITEM 5010) TaxID=602072 RepID=A0A1R3R811_ASPC5|nr:hypothetical protein ASPCADRAFT_519059 [Aspergillus carbonarius ITEM 5010]